MAVNNYDAAAQLPKWARRGVFREGGSYQGPAEMAKAILSGRWHHTPQELYDRVTAYSGDELLDWAKQNHITILRLVWSPGFSHRGDQVQWQIMRDLIRRGHRRGLKICAYLSVTNSFWQEMFEAEPQAREWRQRAHDGQDVPYMAASYGSIVTRILMCVNRQPWRDYMKYKITRALEAGADALFFDNLFSKCYCSVCQEKFGDYTQSLYGRRHEMPPPEAAEGPKDESSRTGIEVVADSERHKSETRAALSLARDQFWNNSVADFMRELYETALAIKPDVVFYPNAHERWPMNVPCNFKLSEDQRPIHWTDGGPMWTNVALWKYLYEDGGREKPAVNGAHDKVMWAEILAYGCDPIGRMGADWNAWHARHGKRIYADTQPAGRVGLLMRSLQPIPEKSPAVTALARANVQFDIVVYEMLPDRYDLGRYEVLLANDVRFMSDDACERIRRFVRDGGTLIASGQTSLYTEAWEPRPDFALADLFNVSSGPNTDGRFEQAYGRGRVIYFGASVQDAAFRGDRPGLVQQWVEEVTAAQKEPVLRIEAPDGLLASVWTRTRAGGTAATNRWIVHLVNYRPEPVRDVRVTLPAAQTRKLVSPEAAAKKVQLLSPEEGVDLAPRQVAAGEQGTSFVVPEVKVYTVAVVE